MNGLLALGLSVLAASAGAAGPPAKVAPLYAGRPLSAWLADLESPNPLVREEAVVVLGKAGPAAREAVPALKKLLEGKTATLRRRAALALWRITGDAKPSAPILTEALAGGDLSVRREAVVALGQMGPDGALAATAILARMDDRSLSSQAIGGHMP